MTGDEFRAGLKRLQLRGYKVDVTAYTDGDYSVTAKGYAHVTSGFCADPFDALNKCEQLVYQTEQRMRAERGEI